MERLDVYLLKKGYFTSRERAKDAILEGQVFIDGKPAKPSQKVSGEEEIKIGEILKYVSRGALKLERAIDEFKINLKDKIVLDIGSSTGGFTEVALLNGAKKVIAVDVGSEQMHERLRHDQRVELFESTDFRYIEKEKLKDVNFVVSDVSFISLKNIFPKIIEVLGTKIPCVILFKPQFECGKEIANRYCGVIRNKKIHSDLLTNFVAYLTNLGFRVSQISHSPITGKTGNIEYLLYLNGEKAKYNIQKTIDVAFEKL